MKVVQLSTFLENRMGAVKGPLETLANAKIDVATLTLADISQSINPAVSFVATQVAGSQK